MKSYIYIPNDSSQSLTSLEAEDLYDANVLFQENGADLTQGEVTEINYL